LASLSAFSITYRTTDPNDFGVVVVGLVLLALSEVIAIMLAAIGFIVKAILSLKPSYR
jgi:hypothetical protein